MILLLTNTLAEVGGAFTTVISTFLHKPSPNQQKEPPATACQSDANDLTPHRMRCLPIELSQQCNPANGHPLADKDVA